MSKVLLIGSNKWKTHILLAREHGESGQRSGYGQTSKGKVLNKKEEEITKKNLRLTTPTHPKNNFFLSSLSHHINCKLRELIESTLQEKIVGKFINLL